MSISTFVFSVVLTFQAQAQTAKSLISEDDASAARQLMGIQTLDDQQHFTVYAFRDEGRFMVSKNSFKTTRDAEEFCSRHQGFNLTSGMLPGVLILMGLPFADLQKHMIVATPVLGPAGGRTGVVAWIHYDLAQLPADQSQLSSEIKDQIGFIRTGDYFFAALNGDGGNGSGIHSTTIVNRRLRALGLPSLELPAICEDTKLAEAFRR